MARYRARHTAALGEAALRPRGDSGRFRPRGGSGRLRRGISATALVTAVMAAVTASQAPGFGPLGSPGRAPAGEGSAGATLPEGSPGDGSYHTELPPLGSPHRGPGAPGLPGSPGDPDGPGGLPALRGPQAGIPASVLAAYRKAERQLTRTDPGCRLPWELLAAIGKVESGQASGGAVDEHGTTVRPILGPQLNGNGFARITDTDGGLWDGDTTHDRAVGPMQFIPSTWAAWGADGNGDGRRDPNNVYDAAQAAGEYLCAGDRDLSRAGDLRSAILSYNHSTQYVRTVLSWLEYYRKGTHAVPDGEGALPERTGGGDRNRSGGGGGSGNGNGNGGGIDPGTGSGGSSGSGGGSGSGGSGGGSGSGGGNSGGSGGNGGGTDGPGTSPRPTPGPTGGDSGSPTPSPTGSDDPGTPSPDPSPTDCPTDPESPSPSPAPTEDPAPEPTGSPTPSGTPSPGETC